MVARTPADITALVTEAIDIDKEIVAQLNTEDVNGNFNDIYDGGISTATELSSLSAAERVQRIVSTLIEEDNTEFYFGNLNNNLDTSITDNLASLFKNIESHLNAFEDTVELILDSAPSFILNEEVTGGATGRVLYQNGNKIIISNASGSYTGTITGVSSSNSASIEDYNLSNNLGSDIKQYTRQADAIRVFLEVPPSTKKSGSVSFNYDVRRGRDDYSINVSDYVVAEGDTISVRIGDIRNKNRDEFIDPDFKVWIVDSLTYFDEDINADPSRVAIPNSTGVMTNNGSSYNKTITWKIPYGTKRNYYIYVDGRKSATGKITINTSPWIQDEKITGSIKGEGHLLNYESTSALGYRALDIYDIHHEFKIGETISGNKSGLSGTILDIIHYNQIFSGASDISDFASAALYKTFIEEGYAGDITNNVTARQQSLSIERFRGAISGAKGI
mgnify:CR=1 FL=1